MADPVRGLEAEAVFGTLADWQYCTACKGLVEPWLIEKNALVSVATACVYSIHPICYLARSFAWQMQTQGFEVEIPASRTAVKLVLADYGE